MSGYEAVRRTSVVVIASSGVGRSTGLSCHMNPPTAPPTAGSSKTRAAPAWSCSGTSGFCGRRRGRLHLAKPLGRATDHHADVRVDRDPREAVLEIANNHLRVGSDDADRLAKLAAHLRPSLQLILHCRVVEVAQMPHRRREIRRPDE